MNRAPLIPDELFPIPVEAVSDNPQPVSAEAVADSAQLMPYEAVAKAIFVKANGLPAYDRVTRFARRTD